MTRMNTKRYQQYGSQNMTRAINLVRKKRWAIRKSAKLCGVPVTSLFDKIKGRSQIGTSMGKPTLLSRHEEELLVNHVKHLASVGYPLSKTTFLRLATNSCIFVGKKQCEDQPLSKDWLKRFLKRWPELKLARPQKLGMRRAQAVSKETVSSYFDELETILQKYHLKDKPHLIFNVDETGFQTDHTPGKCIAPRNLRPLNTVTTERGPITTVLATGSAGGTCIPPLFVFKGKKLFEELKAGAYPGSSFYMSDSGWSNGEIFQNYLKDHFLKHLPSRDPDQHVLLLYDGHKSHISVPLIEFAKSHNIILFVLPPHTSHVLQPLDKGFFRPLKSYFNYECEKFLHQNPGRVLTRYDLTALISKCYASAFTPTNLFSAFRTTGIYPTNRGEISETNFKIAANLKQKKKPVPPKADQHLESFLQDQMPKMQPLSQEATNATKRRYSYRPGGVAITEDRTLLKIRKVVEEKENGKTKGHDRSSTSKNIQESQAHVTTNQKFQNSPESVTHDEDSETENCCVCKKFSPPEMRRILRQKIKFVDWAQCHSCDHWTHLEFCTPETKEKVSGSQPFYCPHCKNQEE